MSWYDNNSDGGNSKGMTQYEYNAKSTNRVNDARMPQNTPTPCNTTTRRQKSTQNPTKSGIAQNSTSEKTQTYTHIHRDTHTKHEAKKKKLQNNRNDNSK